MESIEWTSRGLAVVCAAADWPAEDGFESLACAEVIPVPAAITTTSKVVLAGDLLKSNVISHPFWWGKSAYALMQFAPWLPLAAMNPNGRGLLPTRQRPD